MKSVNKSSLLNLNREEYETKMGALKECYMACSKKTGYSFYLPVLDGVSWKITKMDNGEAYTLTLEEFKSSLK